jgi:importin subunit beta-1
MTKQEDDFDDDDFGLSSSAALCLEDVTVTAGRDVFPAVFDFVQKNLQNPDWHFREAAIMALGNMFAEGTEGDSDLVNTAEQCLEPLLNLTRDQNALVKDSAVWLENPLFLLQLIPRSDQFNMHEINLPLQT